MRNLRILIFAAFLSLSPPLQVNGASPLPVNEKVILGIERLYNWEFEKAEETFRGVVLEDPHNPAGYFYLSMVTWSRLASGFWSLDVVEEYGRRIDRTIEIAKKSVQKGRADSFTYLYLGGALGFKGRFQLMERKWFSSFFLAVEAIEALKTCREMDPDNRDVLFGLGIFEYYTARLSGVIKFLSYLLIHKGDKAEGLKKIHLAADEALYSSIEAKSLLIHIYLYMEPRLQHRALQPVTELSNLFQANPRYQFFKGVTYFRLGMDAPYREVLKELEKKAREEPQLLKANIWKNQARYLEGSYYLFHGQYDIGGEKLQEILNGVDPLADPFMNAWPLLKQGMIADVEGEREKAVKTYERILKMDNGAGAQFLAQKYIQSPAKKGDPFFGY